MCADSKNTIVNGDVLNFLSRLPSASFDTVIADPPYGIEKDFGRQNNWASIKEWAEWCRIWLTECNRVLKNRGNILVYGIHNYICYNHVVLYELGLSYRRQFIWHYENGFCGHRFLPRATYEPILWFSKGDSFYFEEIREPYKSVDRLQYKVVKNGKVWRPNPLGRIAGDVWPFPTLAGRRFRDEKVDHPTQKPLALSERLVRHFCPEQGTILVPFAGSGSECVAAFRSRRNFVACEINTYYCLMAEERLRQEGWRKDRRGQVAKSASGENLVGSPESSLVSQ